MEIIECYVSILKKCNSINSTHSRYLNAIQTMCPHILRYLTTAVITNKDVRKRRQVLKDLVKVIQQVPDLLVVHNSFNQLIDVRLQNNK